MNKQVVVVCVPTAPSRALPLAAAHRNAFIGSGQGAYSVHNNWLRVPKQRQILINIMV